MCERSGLHGRLIACASYASLSARTRTPLVRIHYGGAPPRQTAVPGHRVYPHGDVVEFFCRRGTPLSRQCKSPQRKPQTTEPSLKAGSEFDTGLDGFQRAPPPCQHRTTEPLQRHPRSRSRYRQITHVRASAARVARCSGIKQPLYSFGPPERQHKQCRTPPQSPALSYRFTL